jgi:hypothetical protein
MNKKESIIHYFEKMDIGMLEILLDDSKTYQNAHKNIFLEKLEMAFTEFRNSQDTFLNSSKGKCCNKACPNMGCKGFSFVGNVSGRHIDLIFEDTDTDYADIYQCHGFDSASKNENESVPVILDIKDDEKADFIPDVDFLILSQKCRNAYEELTDASKGNIIGQDIYVTWLKKHRDLFYAVELSPILYSDYEKFYGLFVSVLNIAGFTDFEDEAGSACKDYLISHPDDKSQLLQWLRRYEKLDDQLKLFPFPDSPYAKDIDKGYFIIEGIRIDRVDFENIMKFKKIYTREVAKKEGFSSSVLHG